MSERLFYFEVILMKKAGSSKTVIVVVTAMLSAMAVALYLFEIPLIPGNSYLKLDLSDIPALTGGILISPWAVIVIEAIKNIIELLIRGLGAQMGFGNIMNFIVGCAYALTFSLIYKKIKTGNKNNFLKILIPSVSGLVAIVTIGFLANYLISPAFFKAFLNTEITHEVLMAAVWSATVLNVIKGVMLSIVSYPIANVIGEKINLKSEKYI